MPTAKITPLGEVKVDLIEWICAVFSLISHSLFLFTAERKKEELISFNLGPCALSLEPFFIPHSEIRNPQFHLCPLSSDCLRQSPSCLEESFETGIGARMILFA